MKPLTLEEIVAATQGACDRPTALGSITRVTTDSRDVRPGDLFFAIRGERLDGHLFVGEVFAKGAMAAVVRNDFEWYAPVGAKARVDIPPDAVLVRVDDTVAALGQLAWYCRQTVFEGSVTVVAVTGSNGKTTTKSMLLHVLAGRWKGRASVKSFNNEIGVPLTLLSVEPLDEFVICEVGTNAPGEIAALARLIEPEVAVITGVSEAHLEGLGSLDRIADEKVSLLNFLRQGGCAVLNADHEAITAALKRERSLSKIKRVSFGQSSEADLRLTECKVIATEPAASGKAAGSVLEFVVNDRFRYRLNVPGRHNVINALAAIAVARWFGMDHAEIAARLETYRLPAMRLEAVRLGKLTLVNDAYNANPASMAAAIDVLGDMPAAGRRVMVMGDMRELGPDSERLHTQVAEKVAGSAIDVVIAVGERAKLIAWTVKQHSGGRIETHAFASTDGARRRLVSFLRPDDTLLLKGSRALGLEKLAETVSKWAGGPAASGGGGSRSKSNSNRHVTA